MELLERKAPILEVLHTTYMSLILPWIVAKMRQILWIFSLTMESYNLFAALMKLIFQNVNMAISLFSTNACILTVGEAIQCSLQQSMEAVVSSLDKPLKAR